MQTHSLHWLNDLSCLVTFASYHLCHSCHSTDDMHVMTWICGHRTLMSRHADFSYQCLVCRKWPQITNEMSAWIIPVLTAFKACVLSLQGKTGMTRRHVMLATCCPTNQSCCYDVFFIVQRLLFEPADLLSLHSGRSNKKSGFLLSKEPPSSNQWRRHVIVTSRLTVFVLHSREESQSGVSKHVTKWPLLVGWGSFDSESPLFSTCTPI